MFDYPTIAGIALFLSERMSKNPELLRSDPILGYGLLATASSQELSQHPACIQISTISSRHPGPSLAANGFLQSIITSADLQSSTPLSRWDNEAFYSPSLIPSKQTATTRFAAFCTEVDQFDAAAFRLSSAEALALDPQTR